MNLFRPKNLLLVILTQYLLAYLVLRPALHAAGAAPELTHFEFFLLVLTTVLVAAAGYVVNDLLDVEADCINRPERRTVGRWLSARQGWWLYGALVFAGGLLAAYLAWQVGQEPWWLLYPAAVVGLYFYSKKWKGQPLIGNLVVAVFCAGVAAIVLFAERNVFSQIADSQPLVAAELQHWFGGYIAFAFLTTLAREIVKDLEDQNGDRQAGLRTVPLAWGAAAAKKLAGLAQLLALLGALYFVWWLAGRHQWAALLLLSVGVVGGLLAGLWLLHRASEKRHFTRLSALLKQVMLVGLLTILIAWKF